MSVFVFANKWGVQLFVVTVGAKFYLLQALQPSFNSLIKTALPKLVSSMAWIMQTIPMALTMAPPGENFFGFLLPKKKKMD